MGARGLWESEGLVGQDSQPLVDIKLSEFPSREEKPVRVE